VVFKPTWEAVMPLSASWVSELDIVWAFYSYDVYIGRFSGNFNGRI
jgi:hypothetical protein